MSATLSDDRLARGRAQVEDTIEGTRVVIPAKRNWFMLVFLGLWLCGWAFGEVTVIGSLLGVIDGFEDDNGGRLFVTVWLLLWTVGGGFALLAFLWQLIGREVVTIGGGRLVHARVLGPGKREKSFDTGRIEDLRADKDSTSMFEMSASMKFWGLGGGAIAFDYGARTHRFGASLDEAEAKQLTRRIEEALR